MEYIISVLLFLIDTFSLLNIVEAFFEDKVSKKKKNVYIASVVTVSFLICNLILTGSTIYEAVIVVALWLITINLTYYGNIRMKLFYIMLWYFSIIASEYVIIIISTIVFGVGIEGILADKVYFILFSVTSRFSLYFLTFVFKKVRRNRAELNLYS